MLNEMNSSLIDFGGNETKKTKHELNRNAIKFHLTKLRSQTIRYEVIYKNLVRDVRKYFISDFNGMSSMQEKPQGQGEYNQMLTLYAKITLSKYSTPLGLNLNDLIFNLGSIINPKNMLRIHGRSP